MMELEIKLPACECTKEEIEIISMRLCENEENLAVIGGQNLVLNDRKSI